MDTTKKLKKIYKLLLNHYGKQNWWPAPTKLECILGTILTQNTSWKNVEKGLENLRSHMEINYKNLKNISKKAAKGESFVVVNRSKPVFRVIPYIQNSSDVRYGEKKKNTLKDIEKLKFSVLKDGHTNLSERIDEIAYDL